MASGGAYFSSLSTKTAWGTYLRLRHPSYKWVPVDLHAYFQHVPLSRKMRYSRAPALIWGGMCRVLRLALEERKGRKSLRAELAGAGREKRKVGSLEEEEGMCWRA